MRTRAHTHYPMGKPWKRYAKGMKPDTEALYYDSIYLENPKSVNPQTGDRSVAAGGWVESGCLTGRGFLLGW